MPDLEDGYHQVSADDSNHVSESRSRWCKVGLTMIHASFLVLLPMAAMIYTSPHDDTSDATSLFGRTVAKESRVYHSGLPRFVQPRSLVQARADQEAPQTQVADTTDERKWDFGRFAKQAGFFGYLQPPSPVKVIGRIIGNDKAQNIGPKTVLWSPTLNPFRMVWGSLDDVIMGGSSSSTFDSSSGVWSGDVIVKNGGFAGIRTQYVEPALDLTSCTGLKLKIKGQGQRIKFIIRDDEKFNGIAWSYSFDTNPIFDTTVKIKFSDFVPTKFAQVAKDETLNVATITTFQLTYSKFEYQGDLNSKFKPGNFEVMLKELETY
jgi:hypothetical protein